MLDRLEDVRSDMSVLHRVDDLEAMPAAKLFTLADRLPFYQGAVSGGLAAEAESAARLEQYERMLGEQKAAAWRDRLSIVS